MVSRSEFESGGSAAVPPLVASELKVRTVLVPCFLEVKVMSDDDEEAQYVAEKVAKLACFSGNEGEVKFSAMIGSVCNPAA